MASKTYHSLKHFARDFRRDMRRVSRTLSAAHHEEAHREGRRLLEQHTPVRSGELADSYVDLVEGVESSPSKITGSKEGIASAVGNEAAHFHAIDFGRRRFDNGRMGGSPKASRGMTKPASEKLTSLSTRSKLQVRAIKAAERRIRG